ncbi:hypothetical protein C8R48DRAFT_746529 [Suillus tomentosus]|nr:hypothetical protein C8R48DRAFT_746529 [Suillus tomentosus]
MLSLIIFMDDVSGNISKQWNKHHTIYMSNANLSHEMLEKEFCIHFAPHAAPMEMMSTMQDSIGKAAESGIFAWDCKDNEEAEECSHAGLHCNYFCRTCKVGGTKEYKESDEGYNSIFVPGQLHTPAGIAAEICTSEKIKKSVFSTGIKYTTTGYILETVVEMGKKLCKWVAGVQLKQESDIKVISNKEPKDLLQGSTLNDTINPLLSVEGFNVHQDTPTQTMYLLEKVKLLDLFQMRLNSIMKDGLDSPYLNTDYICHYKGSLIGKHFKSLAQVMLFLIQDLLLRMVLDGCTTIGELIVHIDVHLAAAHQIREKKAARKAGKTPGAAFASAPPNGVARVPAVLDHPAAKAASKAKLMQKAKEKAPHPCANP